MVANSSHSLDIIAVFDGKPTSFIALLLSGTQAFVHRVQVRLRSIDAITAALKGLGPFSTFVLELSDVLFELGDALGVCRSCELHQNAPNAGMLCAHNAKTAAAANTGITGSGPKNMAKRPRAKAAKIATKRMVKV